jgi:hypothetical protein
VISSNAIHGVTSLGMNNRIKLKASKMIALLLLEKNGNAKGVIPAK